ncbi:hypothetical protein Aperf_G00000065180 [Anoplocephala perfoliata]
MLRESVKQMDSKKVKSEEYQTISSTEEVVRLDPENETIVDEGGWLLEQAMQAAIMNPEENTVVHISTSAESDATRINRDAIDEGGLLLEEAMQAARIEPREEGTVLSSINFAQTNVVSSPFAHSKPRREVWKCKVSLARRRVTAMQWSQRLTQRLFNIPDCLHTGSAAITFPNL